MNSHEVPSRAVRLVEALSGRELTVAVAESLTGGLVIESLVEVPGASEVVRGGVVAYATEVKADLLGVPQDLLDERGAVDPDVALAMAAGVRRLLKADVGLATTGAAGPSGQDGAPPGRVHVAVALPDGRQVRSADLPGERNDVRAGTRDLVLDLALEWLAPTPPGEMDH